CRIAGLKRPGPVNFGVREAAYLRACSAVIRWNAVRAGFGALDAVSAFVSGNNSARSKASAR
ncbi:MAG TPA: hypothetical protein VE175_14255, partial [Woeseiaceae bacterium]|nr:hypothetical protein [Woeseiaceae bacterium]